MYSDCNGKPLGNFVLENVIIRVILATVTNKKYSKAQNNTRLFPIYINYRTCILDQWVTLLQRVDSETQCNSIWRQIAHLLHQASRRERAGNHTWRLDLAVAHIISPYFIS